MNYSPEDLRNGQQVKAQASETPSSFGSMEGVPQTSDPKSFGKIRKAGDAAQRALQLMNDPVEAQRTQNWMAQFGMSNEGMEFNQARMMMNDPQPAPEGGEQ